MFSVADIKKTLPGWPDEIIDTWLLYFANEEGMGWPPPVPFGDHRWGRLLGNRPVSWWADVTWKTEKVDCSFAKLCKRTRDRVEETISEAIGPNPDALTKKRYGEPLRYIMDEGVFPKAMTAMRVADGLSIIDGHHRMSAFHGLQRAPDATFKKLGRKQASLEQDIWMGTHPNGEVPLV